MITAHMLGHRLIRKDRLWVYKDTEEVVDFKNPRPCSRCGKLPTEKGHDPCIANLPGVDNACCGHGVRQGYIQFSDGRIIRGMFLPVEYPANWKKEK